MANDRHDGDDGGAGLADADAAPRRGPGISRGLTRERILDAAKAIFAEHGGARFRIRDLAAALEVQPSAIYHHFDGRDDLLAALSTAVSQHSLVLTEPDPDDGPREQLEYYIRALMALSYNDPLIPRIQLEDIATGDMVRFGEGPQLLVYARERTKRILAAGVAAGVFRDRNVSTLRAMMLGGISAAARWHEYEPMEPRQSQRDLEDQFVDLIFRWLSPSSAP